MSCIKGIYKGSLKKTTTVLAATLQPENAQCVALAFQMPVQN